MPRASYRFPHRQAEPVFVALIRPLVRHLGINIPSRLRLNHWVIAMLESIAREHLAFARVAELIAIWRAVAAEHAHFRVPYTNYRPHFGACRYSFVITHVLPT